MENLDKDVKVLSDYFLSGVRCIFIESSDFFRVINILSYLSKVLKKDFLYFDLDRKFCKFNSLLIQTLDNKKIMSEVQVLDKYFTNSVGEYKWMDENESKHDIDFSNSFLLINFAVVDTPLMVNKIKNFVSFYKPDNYKGRTLIFYNYSKVPDLISRDVKVCRLSSLNEKDRLSVMGRTLGKDNLPSEELVNTFVKETKGMSTTEINNMSLIGNYYGWSDEFFDFLKEEKISMINSKGFLEYHESEISINDVIGLDYLKNWLSYRKAYKDKSEHGLIKTKGILLLGIPGTGKSYISKAIGNLFGLPTLRLDIGKILNSFVGESEKNLREVLSLVEALSPCVLWLDEIEKGLSISQNSTDSGVSYRLFGNLLFWLQETKKDIFVVATSNNIAHLPPELLRKGRFDEIFFVDLPEEKDRELMFKYHINKYLIELGIDSCDYYDQFAKISNGFSGAEIEGVIQNTVIQFVAEGKVGSENSIEYFAAILCKNIESTKPLSVTMSEEITRFKNWADGRVVKA